MQPARATPRQSDKRSIFPGTAEHFKTAWRGMGSSVAVIATEFEGRTYAMLATAVCSVSMKPPSLLICVNRDASAYEAIVSRGAFSVGILSSQDFELGEHIGSAKGHERFSRGTWSILPDTHGALTNLPWLDEAQTTIFCATDKTTDYGSHTIFIGVVEGVVPSREYDPLIYCDGRYRALDSRTA